MKIMKSKLYVAAMLLALVATTAEAKGKPSSGGGGGGTATNYGCKTFSAGSLFTSGDGVTQKKLLMSTYGCYTCNLTTHLCVMQSPTTLFGWTFYY